VLFIFFTTITMAEEKLSSTPKSEEEIKIGQEQEIFR
jgi:hypothetical protein